MLSPSGDQYSQGGKGIIVVPHKSLCNSHAWCGKLFVFLRSIRRLSEDELLLSRSLDLILHGQDQSALS